jgi:DNA-binding FrmR family transcriptional regulator
MPAPPSHTSQLQRLRLVEGQVRGVIKMIENKRYCMDILQQTRAISAALKAVENNIMKDHMISCVATALKSNKKKEQANKIKEVIEVMSKFNS